MDEVTTREAVAALIRAVRTVSGMSQANLAEYLGMSRARQSHVSRWENARDDMPPMYLEPLQNLAQEIGVPQQLIESYTYALAGDDGTSSPTPPFDEVEQIQALDIEEWQKEWLVAEAKAAQTRAEAQLEEARAARDRARAAYAAENGALARAESVTRAEADARRERAARERELAQPQPRSTGGADRPGATAG